MSDLTRRLADLGREPVHDLDTDALWDRVVKQRRRRQGVAALLVVAVSLAGLAMFGAVAPKVQIAGLPPACPTLSELIDGAGQDIPLEGDGLSGWALLMHADGVWRRGDEVKVVVQLTGRGPLHASAAHPAGSTVEPVSDPTNVAGSNWERPGDEYVMSFSLPRPGCWTLVFSRSTGHATLDVRVDAAE